jgi:hypothetical protein
MNQRKKPPLQAHGANLMRARQTVNAQPPKAGVMQPKMATAAQMRKPPVAPPVYRPQPVPKVMQMKTAIAPPLSAQSRRPVAPPVYRPQMPSKAVQAKGGPRMAIIQLCAVDVACPQNCQTQQEHNLYLLGGKDIEVPNKHIKGQPGGNAKTTKASADVQSHGKQSILDGTATVVDMKANSGNDIAFSVPRQHHHKVRINPRVFNVHKGGGNGLILNYYMASGDSESESSDDEG